MTPGSPGSGMGTWQSEGEEEDQGCGSDVLTPSGAKFPGDVPGDSAPHVSEFFQLEGPGRDSGQPLSEVLTCPHGGPGRAGRGRGRPPSAQRRWLRVGQGWLEPGILRHCHVGL